MGHLQNVRCRNVGEPHHPPSHQVVAHYYPAVIQAAAAYLVSFPAPGLAIIPAFVFLNFILTTVHCTLYTVHSVQCTAHPKCARILRVVTKLGAALQYIKMAGVPFPTNRPKV